MRIVDRYVLKNVVTSYLFIFCVFVGLFFIADLFTNLTDILKAKTPFPVLGQYYLYMLPLIFKWVSPYSLLISVLYVFGELNKNNEIITIRSAGISVIRFSFPVLFLAFFISVIAFFMQENLLMASQKRINDIKIQSIKKNTSATAEDLSFSSSNKIIFARSFSLKDKTLHGVTIFEKDTKENIIKKVICSTITYEDDHWVARDVYEYHLDENGRILDRPAIWQKLDIALEEKPQEIIFKRALFSEFAPLKNIHKEIRHLKRIQAYDKLQNLIIDYHQKIVEPFSHFFLIVGILPFALEIKKRKVTLSAIGVGLMFGFIYYSFLAIGVALGKAGMILPVFAPWTTPIFFLVVGFTGIFFIR
ncbi:MAG: LptF/LptG family permease [Candidatus Omnitrophota bacterium]|nr:LptF/LptG family permease [Candidatus Omnitrophota bacterium]